MKEEFVEEMTVKNYMIRDTVTLTPEDSVRDAYNLLQKHNLGQVPVVKDGKVIGVVKDKSLHSVLDEPLCVGVIMTSDPITILEDSSIILAAQMICHYKLDALPVVSDTGKLVGMVTITAILHGLLSASEDTIGELESSKRAAVYM